MSVEDKFETGCSLVAVTACAFNFSEPCCLATDNTLLALCAVLIVGNAERRYEQMDTLVKLLMQSFRNG